MEGVRKKKTYVIAEPGFRKCKACFLITENRHIPVLTSRHLCKRLRHGGGAAQMMKYNNEFSRIYAGISFLMPLP